jgi:Family of unknown function (DUF6516)
VPKAEKLLDVRVELDGGFLLALRLWRTASPVPPSTHSFKYALFYGRSGERWVLFDNERGKGDHKHILEAETPYQFTTPDKLIEDFQAAVRAVREGGSR